MKILKIFDGFITNSSSVNFMIATKEELTEELLEDHLRRYPETRLQASLYAKQLWERIALEEEPYEYDFYELTLGKGSFHYYPGNFGNDDHRMFPIHGVKIEKEDFILAIGYFERTPRWQEEYIQKVYVKHKEREMIGVELYLSWCNLTTIANITNLCDLKNVMILNLNGNNIKKIEGLNCLDNLRRLNLSNNKIRKLQGLEALSNLEKIYLTRNQIEDLVKVKLPYVKYLNVSENQIKDIDGLISPNLETLYLNKNQLFEIRGLDDLLKLTWLHLSTNPIKKINNLEHLEKLRYLYLDETQIERIEGLENLTNLKSLSLRSTDITNIEGLDNLKNLESLDISNNYISEIKGLGTLNRLKSLCIKDTQIPHQLIGQLGGIDRWGYVNNPEKFVEYCKKNK